MAYIGPEPNPGQNREVDDISSSFNGSLADFTLQVNSQNVSPGSSNAIIVSLGGVVQNPGTDYTVAASTLTFTTAPASGLSFFGLVLGQSIDTEGTADGSIVNASVSGSAAIAGTKISPDFGSQNILTTGNSGVGTGTPESKFAVKGSSGDADLFSISDVAVPTSGGEYGVAMIKTNSTEFALNITGYNTASKGLKIYNNGASAARTSFEIAQAAGSKFVVDGIGNLQMGSASDNLGAATVNIVSGSGHSINLSRNQGAACSNNQRMGAIAFHPGLGSQTTVTGGAIIEAFADEDQSGSSSATRLAFLTKPSGTSPGSAATERLRIHSTGVVQVMSERLTMGTSATSGGVSDGNFCIEYDGASRNAIKTRNTASGNHIHMVMVSASTATGTISGTSSSVSFNNLSDYRKKENAVAISDGITRIKTLKPYRFNFIIEPSKTIDGFFAHEVTPAVPEAVTGEKDAVDSEGKIDPQMLDSSKLVPLLTAALQEAITKIETLETKVAALEAA